MDIAAHDAFNQSGSCERFPVAVSEPADDQRAGSRIQHAFDVTINAQGAGKRKGFVRQWDRFRWLAIAFEERLNIIRPAIKLKRSLV